MSSAAVNLGEYLKTFLSFWLLACLLVEHYFIMNSRINPSKTLQKQLAKYQLGIDLALTLLSSIL